MALSKRVQLLLFSTLLSILSVTAGAEIYKWVDKDGKVHFSDSQPEDQPSEEVRVEINSLKFPQIADNPIMAVGKREVIMYSTTWCGYCRKARAFFKRKGISFKEYDVENSVKGKRDYTRLNGHGVTIILVGEKRMNGFSEQRFMSIYNR